MSMLKRPVPEFGGLHLLWSGGKKVVLLDGEKEIDSRPLEHGDFVSAAEGMEKFRRELNETCQG